jgi:hypothetical protein
MDNVIRMEKLPLLETSLFVDCSHPAYQRLALGLFPLIASTLRLILNGEECPFSAVRQDRGRELHDILFTTWVCRLL